MTAWAVTAAPTMLNDPFSQSYVVNIGTTDLRVRETTRGIPSSPCAHPSLLRSRRGQNHLLQRTCRRLRRRGRGRGHESYIHPHQSILRPHEDLPRGPLQN